jgi:hypothetical protein
MKNADPPALRRKRLQEKPNTFFSKAKGGHKTPICQSECGAPGGPLLNGKTSAKSVAHFTQLHEVVFCVPSLNAVSLEQSQQISKIETCLVLVLVAIGSHQNLSRHPSHFGEGDFSALG